MKRPLSRTQIAGMCAICLSPIAYFYAHHTASTAGESSTAAGAGATANPGAQATVEPGTAERLKGGTHNRDKTLARNIAILEKGIEYLRQAPGYTATFHKQELLMGSLRDLQTIDLKLRHEPFSVYMKWRKSKEEVLYHTGRNSNKLRVHHVGVKGLLGDLELEPCSRLAMTESRHPITEMGMLNLAKTVLSYRTRDLGLTHGVSWQELPGKRIGDRECEGFLTLYDDPDVEPVYRKAICYFDKELSIPVCVNLYGWGDGNDPLSDEATLLEHYAYSDIKFDRLQESHFDFQNADYAFRH